jgi:hypothetical protein
MYTIDNNELTIEQIFDIEYFTEYSFQLRAYISHLNDDENKEELTPYQIQKLINEVINIEIHLTRIKYLAKHYKILENE